MPVERFRGIRLCLLLPLAAAGCGGGGGDQWTENLPPTVEAAGTLLLDGKPVEGASIVLSPVAEDGHAAMGLSGSGGYFVLKAFPSKEGAVPGSYQVGVTKSEETASNVKKIDWGEDAAHAEESPATTTFKNALPQQYANPANSALTLQIPEGGSADLKIELKSKP